MLLALALLWLSVFWAQCEKVSPKPGLKLFREDYKSVQETCIAVGFVKNSCGNDTKIGIYIDNSFTTLYKKIIYICLVWYMTLYLLYRKLNGNKKINFETLSIESNQVWLPPICPLPFSAFISGLYITWHNIH